MHGEHSLLLDCRLLAAAHLPHQSTAYTMGNARPPHPLPLPLPQISLNSLDEKHRAHTFRKVELLKVCDHPNIVKYMDSLIDEEGCTPLVTTVGVVGAVGVGSEMGLHAVPPTHTYTPYPCSLPLWFARRLK